MTTDLPLRCACGSVRGVLRGATGAHGNRIVCYCDDCQAFAWFLGGAERILDAYGGTDIFQTSPARLELGQGSAHVTCMRLTPGGLVRWYTDCCRTPVGNTLATRQVPFVGLIHSFVDHAADGRRRDDVLGPVRGRVHARFAKGDRAGLEAHERAPARMLLRFGRILLGARLRGDHVRSPFFDPASGALRATPRVLTDGELRSVERARDAA